MLKTTNGGVTWSVPYNNSSIYIQSIYALNESVCWGIGINYNLFHPIIIRTTNSGIDWDEFEATNVPDLLDLYFINNSNGYAVGTDGSLSGNGGFIYKSNDGGINWNVVFTGLRCGKIEFSDSLNGYAIGENGTIVKTSDGGNNWYYVNSGTNSNLSSISIINSNNCTAVGTDGTIIKSYNNGNSWNNLSDPPDFDIYSIDFANENYGVGVGRGGKIIQTTNGGTTWLINPYTSPAWALYSVTCPDIQNIWASGHDGSITHSSNSGLTWVQQNSGVSIPLRSIYFINSMIGWAAGNGGVVLKTTDGGNNWVQQNTQTTRWLFSIYFLNENIGWAAGSYSTVIKTTNGGDNWQSLTIPGIQFIEAISFVNENVGWIIGGSSGQYGIILKTMDGGSNWSTQFESNSSDFNDVYFKDENSGIVVGRYGQILGTTDGGINWFMQDHNSYNEFFSIGHCENSEIWISGSYGTILHSLDGGIPVELTSFTSLINNNNVTLNWSTATETNNQGFEIERNTPLNPLSRGEAEGRGVWEKIGFVNGKGTITEPQSYSFVDENLQAGNYQYRLKQIDFDGSFEYSNTIKVEIGAPNEFHLSQNYPNPFNPSTKISWQSPVGGWQTLKVYDILGNEVSTLVNEYKPEGSYNVEFRMQNLELSSGIYFYQLKAGDPSTGSGQVYVATKKMILLK